jgi:hypothetical protein
VEQFIPIRVGPVCVGDDERGDYPAELDGVGIIGHKSYCIMVNEWCELGGILK